MNFLALKGNQEEPARENLGGREKVRYAISSLNIIPEPKGGPKGDKGGAIFGDFLWISTSFGHSARPVVDAKGYVGRISVLMICGANQYHLPT